MNKKKIKNIFSRFYENNPHPIIELNFKSNFELLVSVLLSAKSKDTSVNKVTSKLYRLANTPKKMILLGRQKIEQNLKSLGLYKKKSVYIFNTCLILIKKYNSQIPSNRKDLESLPGIGRKSASIILNIAFGYSTIAVDTHVLRVSNRLGLLNCKNTKKTEKILQKIIPNKFQYYCHNWLVLHGRYICSYYTPKCKICFIQDLCQFTKKNN